LVLGGRILILAGRRTTPSVLQESDAAQAGFLRLFVAATTLAMLALATLTRLALATLAFALATLTIFALAVAIAVGLLGVCWLTLLLLRIALLAFLATVAPTLVVALQQAAMTRSPDAPASRASAWYLSNT
jgi:hypothetical protein